MKVSQKVILACTLLLSIVLAGCDSSGKGGHTETALARVVRTQTIRCGYVISEPYLMLDPNTGAFSGIAFDYMTALAKEFGVKLEWAEETGWGNVQEGLNANKFDVFCVPTFQSGERARIMLLSNPVFYTGLYLTARANDNRFDTIDEINKAKVRIKIMDNTTRAIKQDLFPTAAEDLSMQVVGETQLYLDVATKKVDVGFGNPGGLSRFNANTDVKLKLALQGKPVRVFGTSLAVKLGETDLKNALDTVISTLNTNGVAENIINAYAPLFQATAK